MRNLCFLNHSTSALFIRSIPVVVILPQGGPYFSESLVGLRAPWHPTPCLYFVLLSSSRALKWLISCNLLTQAFFMQMSRNCFQASVLLTGQAGTFLHVSQLTARRALISSHLDVCWPLWTGVPHRAEEVKEHLALQCCQFSSPLGWKRPLHCCSGLPLGTAQLLPCMEQTSVQFDVWKQ